ncbi:MAG: hypothetical protein COX36_02240 [Candidatus Nealsonbacteria bacterium CG23_combo_of_CG06-09_8_20_14_all_38_19]|uniref:N-acetyltransferase domain-containing protein n=1 Tax=Candidatus Nealsonbacteria bacterium CG23_combo_of_CG06-09_8_20_14_all_38_19 TaxID=1974721 RepID=A0A2G9YWM8_9BACT|nr:MAG: hypothetical protein COX36_02240 [Candidatus Nealsonbacteria bacterium CG23_combo_of_CG06-09_8_20_14_all_38_19]
MEIQIRRATEEEMNAIAVLAAKEIYQGDFTKKEMRGWLTAQFPFAQHFVVTIGSKIVACATWWLHDRFGNKQMLELSIIAVKSRYRRHGIGKELVRFSLEEVRKWWRDHDKGVSAVIVFTDQENLGSQAFYKAVLEPDQEVILKNVWGEDGGSVIYVKRLEAAVVGD